MDGKAQRDEDEHQHECGGRGDDPHRDAVGQPRVAGAHAGPLRRKLAVDALAQHLGQALANAVELRASVVEHAIAPFQAQRQHEVHQLEQVAMARHVFGQLAHQLEHLLAAPRLVVEQHQQAVRRPCARAAPGRARRALVEQGAQRVAARDHLLVGQAGGARLGLELAHALDQRGAQRGGVRMLRHHADTWCGPQQRRGRLHQRIDAGHAGNLGQR